MVVFQIAVQTCHSGVSSLWGQTRHENVPLRSEAARRPAGGAPWRGPGGAQGAHLLPTAPRVCRCFLSGGDTHLPVPQTARFGPQTRQASRSSSYRKSRPQNAWVWSSARVNAPKLYPKFTLQFGAGRRSLQRLSNIWGWERARSRTLGDRLARDYITGPASCQTRSALEFSLRSQETRFKNKQPTWAHSALSVPSCVEISGPGALLLSQQHRESWGEGPASSAAQGPRAWVQAEKRGAGTPGSEESPLGEGARSPGSAWKQNSLALQTARGGQSSAHPREGPLSCSQTSDAPPRWSPIIIRTGPTGGPSPPPAPRSCRALCSLSHYSVHFLPYPAFPESLFCTFPPEKYTRPSPGPVLNHVEACEKRTPRSRKCGLRLGT